MDEHKEDHYCGTVAVPYSWDGGYLRAGESVLVYQDEDGRDRFEITWMELREGKPVEGARWCDAPPYPSPYGTYRRPYTIPYGSVVLLGGEFHRPIPTGAKVVIDRSTGTYRICEG